MKLPLLPGLCLLLAVTACATTGGSSGEASAESGDLTWGDGPYGVVLAHGASFDAASWEEQAVRIADQGATVIAVESIATTRSKPRPGA